MNRQTVIDTDITIDFLRGNKQAVSLFKAESASVCFSAVTVSEIYAGIKNRQEEVEIERLFSLFSVFAVTTEIAREAGKFVNRYRSSYSVEIPDAIIAATCLILGCELHTLNIRHYPMFKNLLPPYKKNSKDTLPDLSSK